MSDLLGRILNVINVVDCELDDGRAESRVSLPAPRYVLSPQTLVLAPSERPFKQFVDGALAFLLEFIRKSPDNGI